MAKHLVHCFARWEEEGMVILPKSMGSTARKMRTMKMDDRPGFSLQVFARGVDVDIVVLVAARASRVEKQDAIDTAIVGTLSYCRNYDRSEKGHLD
ncbi:hypothetical protein RHMOL_Rhmol12G0222300 [Rhododendron molle]|uniref:Uncharacterized protein n=1 Tax=Rhododendron molle TaxID=49168 RepID=A0ACC0LMK3_RHOML|nr:hypothetical protein RHMOL_Rhmol12G0222300 [Rhododendron molle]